MTRDRRPDGLPALGLIDLRTGDAQPVEGSLITRSAGSIPADWVAFSSDGEVLYWQSGDLEKTLYRANRDGTDVRRLLEVEAESISWSPNFELVAYTSVDPAAGTATLRVSRIDGSDPRDLASAAPGVNTSTLSFAWRPQK